MIYPTIKQLRYFVSLCDEEHFGRAATLSFVSQSAFSAAIQNLEAALDIQLVDRTNRQVTITATGQEIATQARLCLRDVESLVEMAGQRRAPPEHKWNNPSGEYPRHETMHIAVVLWRQGD